jgi:hypothetical protein
VGTVCGVGSGRDLLDAMNKDDACHALEERKRDYLARIPASAPTLRARYLRNQIEDAIGGAGKHLTAIYLGGLEVGPGLSALPALAGNPKYGFWMEGIRRHLQSAEAILAEQPV